MHNTQPPQTPMARTRLLRRFVLPAATALAVLALVACGGADGPAERPNILLIVADDMGYSDIGAFGSEIATPNIDALVREGRVLTSFYTAAACSPTRGMLMSGADSHRVGFGMMDNNVTALVNERNAPFGVDFGFDAVPVGYGGHLIDAALSMPALLRDAGYNTYMAGKWHLATQFSVPNPPAQTAATSFKPSAFPNAKGFERSFAMLNGAGSHYAPVTGKLTRFDRGVTYTRDDVAFPATELPADFYSTKTYTDQLIEYIGRNRPAGKPFFAYAAYTAPHWPLQAPETDIAAQAGRYNEGYEVVRQRRIDRMKQLGVLPAGFVANDGLASAVEGGTGKRRWSELSPQERAVQARAMEVYAAMVSNLDGHIGRLVQHLKDTGQYDNTLIFFMSDNGSDPYPAPAVDANADNTLANMGRPRSTFGYGERWAEVSAAPFRLWKTLTGAEGAVSVPAFVKLPHADRSRVPLTTVTHVKDLLPTFLELAGVQLPSKTYRGIEVVPITGVSLHTALLSEHAAPRVRPASEVIAHEYLGQGFVQRDGWKLSKSLVPGVAVATNADLPWRLFNLTSDRGETVDLASSHPDLLRDLVGEWDRYVAKNSVILLARPPAPKRDDASL